MAIQLDQNGPVEVQEALKARVFALPEVEERRTSTAFLGNREIGHFDPWDGSMHIAVPPDLAVAAIEAGWAELHPMARDGRLPGNVVMLYSPRDEDEVNVLFSVLTSAIRNADGSQAVTPTRNLTPDQTPFPPGRAPMLTDVELEEALTTRFRRLAWGPA